MKKTFLFLAALVMSVGLSAEKITTVAEIISGNKYYIGATTGETDYYFYVDGSSATKSIKGEAKEDVADAVALTFTAVTGGWTIQSDYGLYLGLKNAKDNGAVQVMEAPVVWTIEEDAGNSLLKLHPNDYYLQKNNSGTQFGSYKNTATNVWLESAGAAPTPAILDSLVIKGKADNMEYEVGEAFDPAGLEVWGIYTKTVKHDSTSQITKGITWTIDPETFEDVSDNESVTLVASYKDLTTTDTTITGINVKAAAPFVIWDSREQGYTASESEVTDFSFGDGAVITGTFDKGASSNIPKYYVNTKDNNTTGAVRLYAGSTLTLAAQAGYKISRVEFGFGQGDNTNTISTKVGKFAVDTWKGESDTVVFTVGGTSGHRRFQTIKVSYIAEAIPAAPALNIYASGLKLNDGKISYLLNAPASALQMIIKNGENIVKTIDITDAAALTMGQHNDIAVDLSDITAAGTYTWALKASAPATEALTLVSDESNRFNFYTPTGMAVDNSMESPFFGRIYVVESREGQSTENGRTTHEGLYIYSADLADVTNQGDAAYNGSVTWAEATDGSDASNNTYKMFGPGRIAVDEAGYVFICDNMRVSGKPITTGLWMMDPANPSANFVEVLDHNNIGTTYNRVNAVAVSGTGADRVVYTIDWSDSIVSYPVGECATPYAGGMTGVVPALASYNIVNAMSSLARGPQGDFWVFQYRGQLDAYPIVSHFNVNGERDFYISSDNNADLAAQSSANIRGNGALSPDGKKIAWAGNKVLSIYDVTYDEFGVPSLSNLQTIATGKNIDAMAFDAAGNIYYASASTEYFFAYAMPKADNSFVTAAPAAQNLVIAAPALTLAEVLDGKTIRRAVACDDAVYVLAIDAQKAPTLVKADFEGNVVTTFATDFCAASTDHALSMPLSDIALTADGVLVGCNADQIAADGSGNHLKIYKWAADGTGAMWLSGNKTWTTASDDVGNVLRPENGNFVTGFAGLTMAYNGTVAKGRIAVHAFRVGAPGSSSLGDRICYFHIDGEDYYTTFNQDMGFTTNQQAEPCMNAALAAGDFVYSAAAIAPVQFTPIITGKFANTCTKVQMADDYKGISGFSFAKGGNAIDWMIIPAEDGAKILNVTSGLATATVEDELTTQGITCDFMFAALVGEAGAKKVMLMRDADIELLDITTQPVYTNLNEIKAAAKAVKVMRNGHVFIIRDGKMFNMQGMIVK